MSKITPEWRMRQDFERRCLEHFNAKRAAGVQIIDDNGSPATPEALFWKAPDGSYGVAAFNVAWIAYRWGVDAAKEVGMTPAADKWMLDLGEEHGFGGSDYDLVVAVREAEKRLGVAPPSQTCKQCEACPGYCFKLPHCKPLP